MSHENEDGTMHNTRSDLVAILSTAMEDAPAAERPDLASRHYDTRKQAQRALAAHLEAALLTHFEISRRGMPSGPGLDQRIADAGGAGRKPAG